MRVRHGSCFVFLAVILLGMPAFGQLSTTSSTGNHVGAGGPASKDAPSLPPHQPIRRQSYTVELKTTTLQTLADGTTITRESVEVRASDSRNRTLTSNSQTIPVGDEEKTVTNVSVDDPVEGTKISWNSQTREARVLKLPPQDQQHGCWVSGSGQMHIGYGAEHPAHTTSPGIRAVAGSSSKSLSASQPPQPASTSEDLGMSMIQGIEVYGQRSTTVIPAGQIGNDKPLVRTIEGWTAPGLGFALRAIIDDPQEGKSTTELENLDLNEPPSSTFQPPDGYKVVLEELHQVACPEPGMPWQ